MSVKEHWSWLQSHCSMYPLDTQNTMRYYRYHLGNDQACSRRIQARPYCPYTFRSDKDEHVSFYHYCNSTPRGKVYMQPTPLYRHICLLYMDCTSLQKWHRYSLSVYQACMQHRKLALSHSGSDQQGKTCKTFAMGSFRIFLHYTLRMMACLFLGSTFQAGTPGSAPRRELPSNSPPRKTHRIQSRWHLLIENTFHWGRRSKPPLWTWR